MSDARRNFKQLPKHHVYGVDANGAKIQAQKRCARLSSPERTYIVTEFAEVDESGCVFRATRCDNLIGDRCNLGLVPTDFVLSDWRMHSSEKEI